MLLSRVGTPVTVNWPITAPSVLGTVLFWCITRVIHQLHQCICSIDMACILFTNRRHLSPFWSAGYVAVFAPQGIGVFEGVAAALAKETAPAWTTVALVAGFRVIVLAVIFLLDYLTLVSSLARLIELALRVGTSGYWSGYDLKDYKKVLLSLTATLVGYGTNR